MIGSALGDAIGELAFRFRDEQSLRRRVTVTGAESDAVGTPLIYTDDTAMAIALAESLLETGSLDEQHLGDTFREHYHREPWRGYASGPPTLFALVEEQGIAYTRAARRLFNGQGSFGNGAAMRIAPLGLYFFDDADLYELARRSAAVTHAHPTGIDGAAVLARAIAQAVKLDPLEPFRAEPFVSALLRFARTGEIQDKLRQVHALLADRVPPLEAAYVLGQTVAAHESVPFALYAFLRHPTSFEDCLFCACLHGGDRDTLGAMACAVCGAYLGASAIPAGWRARLENREQIEGLAIQLAARRQAR
jgi:poly(ADP-ribose) glycohydrolase ARH3